jgi:hypothetical protein
MPGYRYNPDHLHARPCGKQENAPPWGHHRDSNLRSSRERDTMAVRRRRERGPQAAEDIRSLRSGQQALKAKWTEKRHGFKRIIRSHLDVPAVLRPNDDAGNADHDDEGNEDAADIYNDQAGDDNDETGNYHNPDYDELTGEDNEDVVDYLCPGLSQGRRKGILANIRHFQMENTPSNDLLIHSPMLVQNM